MESEKYLEGKMIFKPPYFENENFSEWKNKFENYVKSIDQDLWHIISIGESLKTIFKYHLPFYKRILFHIQFQVGFYKSLIWL